MKRTFNADITVEVEEPDETPEGHEFSEEAIENIIRSNLGKSKVIEPKLVQRVEEVSE